MSNLETQINWAANELGPEGPGAVQLANFVNPAILYPARKELSNPHLPWYEQHNSFINDRGIEVQQYFEVFGHKLSRGSQEILARLPAVCMLGNIVTSQLIEPLQVFFPSLESWQMDEFAVQRYSGEMGKLTWHKDLKRHPGLVVILNLIGNAMVHTRHSLFERDFVLSTGDVLLVRAPELYPSDEDIRPEHSVEIIGDLTRTSVTFRANNKPTVPIKGFRYHNWPD